MIHHKVNIINEDQKMHKLYMQHNFKKHDVNTHSVQLVDNCINMSKFVTAINTVYCIQSMNLGNACRSQIFEILHNLCPPHV